MSPFEKAITTNFESDSSQRFVQFLWKAMSMVLMAPRS